MKQEKVYISSTGEMLWSENWPEEPKLWEGTESQYFKETGGDRQASNWYMDAIGKTLSSALPVANEEEVNRRLWQLEVPKPKPDSFIDLPLGTTVSELESLPPK